ncbi:MAG: hypothetical protein DMG59_22175 [Acidobacteria bacterium]|nr:MAG: hypothetical protein DMG59_22175 [Acidobacteriota bacterium]
MLDLGSEVVVGFNVAKLCELFGRFPSGRQQGPS